MSKMYSNDVHNNGAEYHDFIISIFPDYDQSYVPVWGDEISDCGTWDVIFDKDEILYHMSGGYAPEIGDRGNPVWEPEEISYVQAMEIMGYYE